MDFFNHFYVFLTALFFSLILVPMLRRWAVANSQLDMPDRRKTHVKPIPRLGGVGIFTAFLFAVLVFFDISKEARGILAGALVLFVTGMVDDLYGLSAKKKFLGQIAACFVTMAVGHLYIFRLGNLLGLGEIYLPWWLGVPFTCFAVVGVINALNLLDGLDGLAGGFSVIALGAFLLLGWKDGNIAVTVFSAALLGGIVGFLKYNSYPAAIFMGDAGSLTVGFLLALLAVLMTQQPLAGVQPVVPFIILGLPIVDTLRVMSKRLWRRTSPFVPDRTHVHHRFMDLGLIHRFTVVAIYGLTLLWAILALIFRNEKAYVLLGSYIGSVVLFYLTLRGITRWKNHLTFLRRDSPRSFRESRLFLLLTRWSNRGVSLLMVIFVFYLILVAFLPGTVSDGMATLCFVISIASLIVYFIVRDLGHPALWVCLYLGISVAAFYTEQVLQTPFWGMTSPRSVVNSLFLIAAILIVLKIIFRKPKERFLTTSLEVLLIGMVLSVKILSPELSIAYSLPAFMFKMIVLLLGFKVLGVRSKSMLKYQFFAMQGILLTFFLRGLWV